LKVSFQGIYGGFYMNRKVWITILVFLLTAAAALSCADSPEIVYAPEQTVLTLEEYLAQGRETWFLTGKKEYAVQAEMVSGGNIFPQ
jgi:photosystem II stability/assembly factor-like uncharacterized protein